MIHARKFGFAVVHWAMLCQAAQAGPTIVVGRQVAPAERMVVDQVDHGAWTALLRTYVDPRGRVNYRGWKASAADSGKLDAYLNHLSAASLGAGASRNAKLAFWINAYNALTINGILREYPTSSIRNHTARLFGYNIWKDLHLLVEGKSYSLHEMEHDVLRKMGEPRIHFAIVCASIGCPRLLDQAYTAESVESQLTGNAEAFFAEPSKFRFDVTGNQLWVSPILDWFAEDFGNSQVDQMRRIAPWLPVAARRLAASGQAQVNYLSYDWDLNEQPSKQQ
jgi:hypothetical protein